MLTAGLLAGIAQVAAARLEPLRETELMHAFAGAAVHVGGCCNSGPERFARDGSYSTGDRHVRHGSWTAVGGSICVDLGDRKGPQCRAFGKDRGGQIFQISEGPTPLDQRPFAPIVVGFERDY